MATKPATHRRCCCVPAVFSRWSSSRASARLPSTRATAGCCGRTTRRPTAPRISRRRSSAARACSCLPTTAPAPRCSTSAPRATSRRRARCISRATCATITPAACSVGDHLFGFSHGAQVRHRRSMAWRDRSVGKGSLIFADERLILFSENGVVGLAEASPAGYREHGRFSLTQLSGLPTWSHPIVAAGLLIVRTRTTSIPIISGPASPHDSRTLRVSFIMRRRQATSRCRRFRHRASRGAQDVARASPERRPENRA